MMKSTYQNLVVFMEQRLKERPRGFDLFLKELTANNVRAFDEDVATIYVSGYAFPMELLAAFDVIPFDYEIACNNLPAAISGNGSSIMISAENEGYARDLCSFHRLAIGCMLQGILPKGDLFITSSYYCNGKEKTNEIIANSMGKESILFDVPNEISASSIEYVVLQLKEIASRLERITGNRLNMDRLKESIRWSNKARASLQEIHNVMKSKPCPWDGARACLLELGGALLYGTPVREEINQMLVQEMKERIKEEKLLPEKFRLLWFPWVPVQTTNIFKTLKANHANVVMAEVARIWWSELDERKPFEALALKALQNLHVGKAESRVRALEEIAEEFDVDGAIHFSTPACYHENASLRLIRDALQEKGVPLLNLDGDMTDERNYSPEQTANKLTIFLEML
jgi:benzoyl-CoA reductase/2-hydroxyglutaryl-CoA dehydratase subunit BcrC/BadD/HgdB